jgi:hypothetical protein
MIGEPVGVIPIGVNLDSERRGGTRTPVSMDRILVHLKLFKNNNFCSFRIYF